LEKGVGRLLLIALEVLLLLTAIFIERIPIAVRICVGKASLNSS
jgi:hypothetical protein